VVHLVVLVCMYVVLFSYSILPLHEVSASWWCVCQCVWIATTNVFSPENEYVSLSVILKFKVFFYFYFFSFEPSIRRFSLVFFSLLFFLIFLFFLVSREWRWKIKIVSISSFFSSSILIFFYLFSLSFFDFCFVSFLWFQ